MAVTVNLRHEQIKTVVIGKHPLGNRFYIAAIRTKKLFGELTSHQWNTDGMWVVCYNVCGIAGTCCES